MSDSITECVIVDKCFGKFENFVLENLSLSLSLSELEKGTLKKILSKLGVDVSISRNHTIRTELCV